MPSPDSSAPHANQRTRQVFDDVIERRVVQSLIHDLRSPMAVLGGFFASDSRAESRDLRDRARAAFEQSNRLLDEFIDTVQTGLFEQPPALEDTNVAGFLVDVARLHSGAMRTAVPAIALKIRPAKLRAVVDSRKLRRVLNNLISNAVRHSGATRLVLGARVMIASRYAREMRGRLEHVGRAARGARFMIRSGTEATRARQKIHQSALRNG